MLLFVPSAKKFNLFIGNTEKTQTFDIHFQLNTIGNSKLVCRLTCTPELKKRQVCGASSIKLNGVRLRM